MRNRFSLAVLGAVLSFSLAGCAWFGGKEQKSTMSNIGPAPAASGIIESKRTDEGNTKFEVKIRNLASPHNVVEGTRTYVVWLKPLDDNTPPQKVGVLMPGTDLQAELNGITPYNNFELFVTAESTGTPVSPSDNRVMSGYVRRGA